MALTKREEVTQMKKLSILVLGILITGCAQAARPAHEAAMETSTARMVIASDGTVEGHSQYVTLGKVRTRCMEDPAASYVTATDIIADGNDLQRAAYQTYGNEVDAIVDANIFHVSNYAQRYPLFYDEGHFECEGTAVHFQDARVSRIAARSH